MKKEISKEEILTDIKQITQKLKRFPTYSEYCRYGKYGVSTAERKLGRWNEIRTQLKCEQQSTKAKTLEDKVIKYTEEANSVYKDKVTSKTVNNAALENSFHFKALREMMRVKTIPCKFEDKSLNPTLESAILLLSDWHIGRVIRNSENRDKQIYNIEIAGERVNQLFSNTLRVIERISNNTKIEELVIAIDGDIVDGEGIFPTQAYHTELPPPKQITLAANLLFSLMLTASTKFKRVIMRGVKGNHGRSPNPMSSEEANHDLTVYEMVAFGLDLMKKEGKCTNVDFQFAYGDFINFEVRGKRFHMRHFAPMGDDSNAKKAVFEGWLMTHRADAILYGHWHHFGISDLKGFTLVRNSSMTGSDDLAEKMSVSGSKIGQWLLGVSAKRFPTFSYEIDSNKRDEKKK